MPEIFWAFSWRSYPAIPALRRDKPRDPWSITILDALNRFCIEWGQVISTNVIGFWSSLEVVPNSNLTATDKTLLRRLKSGEQDAATALYLKYAERLQKLAAKQTNPKMKFRVEPEEIVQSVFRTFFRRSTAGQYDVATGEDLWKLLLIIALNKIRSNAEFHRAKKRDFRRTEPLYDNQNATPAVVDDNQTAFLVLKMTIDELQQSLPEWHREIVLCRIEGHSVPKTSELTKRSQRTVERVLQNFRRELLALLESCNE